MTSNAHILSPDTQAVLLLCGRFGRNVDSSAKPLTGVEYNRLAQALAQTSETPGSLLGQLNEGRFSGPVELAVEKSRVVALLKRAAELSLFVEQFTNSGGWIVSRADATYPQRIKKKLREKAPPIL